MASSKVDGGASGQDSPCPPESTRGTEHDFWLPYTPADWPRRARYVPKTANAAKETFIDTFFLKVQPQERASVIDEHEKEQREVMASVSSSRSGGLSSDLLRSLRRAGAEAPPCLRRRPQAGFVLKFRDISYRKLFVNVCRLDDYDGVVAALGLEPEDAQFASVSAPGVSLLLSKASTPSTDKRNRPCVVLHCGCDGAVLDRIHVDGGAGREGHLHALIVRLAEALEGRGWRLAPDLGSVVRLKVKGNSKGDIPEVLRWGFPVREVVDTAGDVVGTDGGMAEIKGEIKMGFGDYNDYNDQGENGSEPLMVAKKTVRFPTTGAARGRAPKGLRSGFLL
jgi:hypothetical protein